MHTRKRETNLEKLTTIPRVTTPRDPVYIQSCNVVDPGRPCTSQTSSAFTETSSHSDNYTWCTPLVPWWVKMFVTTLRPYPILTPWGSTDSGQGTEVPGVQFGRWSPVIHNLLLYLLDPPPVLVSVNTSSFIPTSQRFGFLSSQPIHVLCWLPSRSWKLPQPTSTLV